MTHVKGHIRDRFLDTLEAFGFGRASKAELLDACKGLHNCTDVVPSSHLSLVQQVLGEDWRGRTIYAGVVQAAQKRFIE